MEKVNNNIATQTGISDHQTSPGPLPPRLRKIANSKNTTRNLKVLVNTGTKTNNTLGKYIC